MRGLPRARDSARGQKLVRVKRTHKLTQLGPCAPAQSIRGVQTLASLGGDQVKVSGFSDVINSVALKKLPHSEVHPIRNGNLDLLNSRPLNIDRCNFSCLAQLATLCGRRIAVSVQYFCRFVPRWTAESATGANVDIREVYGPRGIAVAFPSLACERVEPECPRFP